MEPDMIKLHNLVALIWKRLSINLWGNVVKLQGVGMMKIPNCVFAYKLIRSTHVFWSPSSLPSTIFLFLLNRSAKALSAKCSFSPSTLLRFWRSWRSTVRLPSTASRRPSCQTCWPRSSSPPSCRSSGTRPRTAAPRILSRYLSMSSVLFCRTKLAQLGSFKHV